MSEKQLKWVKLAKYCELSGETRDAVMKKRSSGVFLDGVHCKIAGDGKISFNKRGLSCPILKLFLYLIFNLMLFALLPTTMASRGFWLMMFALFLAIKIQANPLLTIAA